VVQPFLLEQLFNIGKKLCVGGYFFFARDLGARIVKRCKRVKFYLFRCKSADLFFSCCGSIASRGNNLGPSIKYLQKNNERRRGHRPRCTRIVRRCTRENLLFSAAHQQSCFLLLRQRRGAAATI
jgi:hypothetical protein